MHCVYIARDGNGDVLYVGRTRDLTRRVTSHRSSSWWSPDVVYEVRPFMNPSAAVAGELAAIAQFDPPHNVDGAPSGRRAEFGARQAQVLRALTAAGRPLTTEEIRLATGYRNTARMVARLHERGCIRPVRYERHGSRSGYMATWAMADSPLPTAVIPDNEAAA